MRLRSCFALLATACAGGGGESPKLTVAIDTPAASTGSVTATSGGTSLFTCTTGSCTATVADGAAVTLTASPADASSRFATWSGGCDGNSPRCTFVVDQAVKVTARFRPNANILFTTATPLNMPFGATADAAQAAANGHCNSSAAAGNLPGHYVAWLSTSTTNAIEKLGSANGWVRTDGRPFANAQADLAAGRIFYPPRVSENGSEVGIQLVAATGTGRDGTALAGGTCNDWTSTAGYAGAGWPSGGSQAWTNAASVSPCSGPFVLYCLETSRSVPVVAAATGRTAFVSTGLFAPGPGRSRASADAMCQSEALAAGLPGPSGNYLALLALDGERPLARFSIDPGLPTWVRPDGVQLVASASQIVNSTLLAPIDVTAERTYLTYVTGGITWTGSLGPNLPGDLASTCNNWGSSEGSGHGGDIERTFLWFNEFQSSIDCHGAARVFCFQQ